MVNIAVPVRVHDGDAFVRGLKLDDFELTEDGVRQAVLAAYLVEGNRIAAREAPPNAPAPPTGRHFVLLFEVREYLPEIDRAVDLFFQDVFRPGDGLDLVTPRKTYRLRYDVAKPEGLRKAREELKAKLRQDVLLLGGESERLVRSLMGDLGGEYEDVREGLTAYEEDLKRLESLRLVEPDRMLGFARELKSLPGSKHVFLFLQRQLVPRYSAPRLNEMLSGASPEMALKLLELMESARAEVRIDREAIERAFADASIDVHFLYLLKGRADPRGDVQSAGASEPLEMAERSQEVYKAFREVAAATGGIAESSADAVTLLKRAVDASDTHYLLYYRPNPYRADGGYRKIEVAVKRPGVRVTHRMGYVATDASALAPYTAPEPAPAPPKPKARAAAAPKGEPAPAALLASVAEYCRRLEAAALNFSCREEVREELSSALFDKVDILGTGRMGAGTRRQEWIYDYLLVREAGRTEESRVLVEENGRGRTVENASLATTRFDHRLVVLGPVGLLGTAAQALHLYAFVKEESDGGEPVTVLDVRPAGDDARSLHGKAWVRNRDGAVLRIEWEPTSMGNFEAIRALAAASQADPKLTFRSEYGFEKNGLRFPSAYRVEERYHKGGQVTLASRTTATYEGYKFFRVETETAFR